MSRSILFISTMNGDPWGGSEEFWYRMATWMAQHEYKVGCCFFEWASGKEDKITRLKQAGCQLYYLPNPKTAKNSFQKMSIRKKGFELLKELCAKDWGLICFSQGGYEDVTHRPFRFLHEQVKKFVLISHNYNDNHRLAASRIKNLAAWTDKAALNMGDAGRIFEGVKKASGLTLPRQYVLKNPLTIPYQATAMPWPGTDESGRYIFTMLAQLDIARKAQDVLINALSGDKWKERNWVLYLYGGGEDMPALKELIRKNQAGEKIKLMGHSKDVLNILQKTNLLLQITHIDAMPLSVTEAMNMARPCVVSRVGDMALWIEHGKNGYIAPVASVEEIDRVMEQAWQEKENWPAMGLEAHRVFTGKYPQPYEEYYANLLMNL